MASFLGFAAMAFILPVMAFGAIQILAPEWWTHGTLRGRLARYKPWQFLAAAVLCGLLFSMMTAGEPIIPLALAALILAALYLRSWRDEFVFLMGLKDDELPSRHDKLIWILMFTFLAPLGAWLFRSYRLAHWPQPEPTPVAEPIAEPRVAANPTAL